MQRLRFHSQQQGFTLLELVVVLTIIALIAGLLAPAGVLAINRQKVSQTEKNMEKIAEAIRIFYEDHGAFPDKLNHLAKTNGKAEWNGPYFVPIENSKKDTNNLLQDSFFNDYHYTDLVENSGKEISITLKSTGPNGVLDDPDSVLNDDIVRTIDMTNFLKEETKREISIINQAIMIYNARRVNGEEGLNDISNKSWPAPLNDLRNADLLPNNNTLLKDLRTDEWGELYEFEKTFVTSNFGQ